MTDASAAPALLWIRQDLRLSDNPAMAAALERRSPVIPVFIWAPEEEGAWPPGAASRWWLHRSLASLSGELEKRGSRLIVRRGPTSAALSRLVAESGAGAVLWNRRYEPAAVARDRELKSKLIESGLAVQSFNGSLLFEPWTIRNNSDQPFRVFTPFWRACLNQSLAPVSRDAPKRLASPVEWPHSLALSELALEPAVDWAGGFREVWQPGESGARLQLRRFLREALAEYPVNRDRPGLAGTSRLSPHLHFGEISPGEVWRSIVGMATGDRIPKTREPARPTSGNSAGANSRTTCCIIIRNRRTRRFGGNSPPSPGGRTPNTSTRGNEARPVTRSSMPACASCGTPAGCTTGRGWSPRRSWSSTC